MPPLNTQHTKHTIHTNTEILIAGELQEPSKRVVARVIEAQDQLVERAKDGEGLLDGEGTARV